MMLDEDTMTLYCTDSFADDIEPLLPLPLARGESPLPLLPSRPSVRIGADVLLLATTTPTTTPLKEQKTLSTKTLVLPVMDCKAKGQSPTEIMDKDEETYPDAQASWQCTIPTTLGVVDPRMMQEFRDFLATFQLHTDFEDSHGLEYYCRHDTTTVSVTAIVPTIVNTDCKDLDLDIRAYWLECMSQWARHVLTRIEGDTGDTGDTPPSLSSSSSTSGLLFDMECYQIVSLAMHYFDQLVTLLKDHSSDNMYLFAMCCTWIASQLVSDTADRLVRTDFIHLVQEVALEPNPFGSKNYDNVDIQPPPRKRRRVEASGRTRKRKAPSVTAFTAMEVQMYAIMDWHLHRITPVDCFGFLLFRMLVYWKQWTSAASTTSATSAIKHEDDDYDQRFPIACSHVAARLSLIFGDLLSQQQQQLRSPMSIAVAIVLQHLSDILPPDPVLEQLVKQHVMSTKE